MHCEHYRTSALRSRSARRQCRRCGSSLGKQGGSGKTACPRTTSGLEGTRRTSFMDLKLGRSASSQRRTSCASPAHRRQATSGSFCQSSMGRHGHGQIVLWSTEVSLSSPRRSSSKLTSTTSMHRRMCASVMRKSLTATTQSQLFWQSWPNTGPMAWIRLRIHVCVWGGVRECAVRRSVGLT